LKSQPGLSPKPREPPDGGNDVKEDSVSLLEPLVLRVEALIYDGLCALSDLAPPDGNADGGRSDALASPLPSAPREEGLHAA